MQQSLLLEPAIPHCSQQNINRILQLALQQLSSHQGVFILTLIVDLVFLVFIFCFLES